MTNDEFRQLLTLFSDNAKTYTQISTAALILPIIFIRQVLGIEPSQSIKENLDWALVISWIFFLLAIAAGLFYQYVAVKRIEAWLLGKNKLLGMARSIYSIMLISFYLGAFFFVVSAINRLL